MSSGRSSEKGRAAAGSDGHMLIGFSIKDTIQRIIGMIVENVPDLSCRRSHRRRRVGSGTKRGVL